MKGVALHAGPFHGCLQKRQIESRVMAHQNRARAAVFRHLVPDMGEDFVQRIALTHGKPERVPGIDAIETQCRFFESRALEGFDVAGDRPRAVPPLCLVM